MCHKYIKRVIPPICFGGISCRVVDTHAPKYAQFVQCVPFVAGVVFVHEQQTLLALMIFYWMSIMSDSRVRAKNTSSIRFVNRSHVGREIVEHTTLMNMMQPHKLAALARFLRSVERNCLLGYLETVFHARNSMPCCRRNHQSFEVSRMNISKDVFMFPLARAAQAL